jgi:hypothetical protein
MRSNFQHYRKRRKVMPPAYHEAMAAHFAADLARRVALPERQADPAVGEEWVSIIVTTRYGSTTISASIPAQRGIRRVRSDQFAVAINSEPVAALEGRTAVLARVAELWPRMLSRKERHESDRINESAFHDPDCSEAFTVHTGRVLRP